jgi:hypothetical protein
MRHTSNFRAIYLSIKYIFLASWHYIAAGILLFLLLDSFLCGDTAVKKEIKSARFEVLR